MSWISKVLEGFLHLFGSRRAQRALNQVADFVVKALPAIDIAAQIITTLTPTAIDDAAFAYVKQRWPRLFDGSVKTADELKLYALGVATDLLQRTYPALSTTVARAAVQLAYLGKKESA